MREAIGPLNRTWLAIIGIIALILGVVSLLLASGLATTLGQALGLAATPAPGQPVVTPGVQALFESAAIVAMIAAAGIILAILALLWIIKQIPRKNQARTLRLHSDGSGRADGLTTCEPRVLTDAIGQQVEACPGVVRSDAILRGTASEPELTIHATVGDRADIGEVIDYIHERTAPDVETALETPLQRLAILFDVSASTKSAKTVVL